jgi:hypothetical protein
VSVWANRQWLLNRASVRRSFVMVRVFKKHPIL